MDILDYRTLVDNFESKLMTQLRGHGADADYLETWVPDQDPVKSVLNMVEAAEAYGRDEIAIRFDRGSLSADQIAALTDQISGLGTVKVTGGQDGTLLVISAIGGGR